MEAANQNKILKASFNMSLPFADLMLVVTLWWQFSCLLRKEKGLLLSDQMEKIKTRSSVANGWNWHLVWINCRKNQYGQMK